jgi:hypothetical protein
MPNFEEIITMSILDTHFIRKTALVVDIDDNALVNLYFFDDS